MTYPPKQSSKKEESDNRKAKDKMNPAAQNQMPQSKTKKETMKMKKQRKENERFDSQKIKQKKDSYDYTSKQSESDKIQEEKQLSQNSLIEQIVEQQQYTEQSQVIDRPIKILSKKLSNDKQGVDDPKSSKNDGKKENLEQTETQWSFERSTYELSEQIINMIETFQHYKELNECSLRDRVCLHIKNHPKASQKGKQQILKLFEGGVELNKKIFTQKRISKERNSETSLVTFFPTYFGASRMFQIIQDKFYQDPIITGQYGHSKTFSTVLYSILSNYIVDYRLNYHKKQQNTKIVQYRQKLFYFTFDVDQLRSQYVKKKDIQFNFIKQNCRQVKDKLNVINGKITQTDDEILQLYKEKGIKLLLVIDQTNAITSIVRQKLARKFNVISKEQQIKQNIYELFMEKFKSVNKIFQSMIFLASTNIQDKSILRQINFTGQINHTPMKTLYLNFFDKRIQRSKITELVDFFIFQFGERIEMSQQLKGWHLSLDEKLFNQRYQLRAKLQEILLQQYSQSYLSHLSISQFCQQQRQNYSAGFQKINLSTLFDETLQLFYRQAQANCQNGQPSIQPMIKIDDLQDDQKQIVKNHIQNNTQKQLFCIKQQNRQQYIKLCCCSGLLKIILKPKIQQCNKIILQFFKRHLLTENNIKIGLLFQDYLIKLLSIKNNQYIMHGQSWKYSFNFIKNTSYSFESIPIHLASSRDRFQNVRKYSLVKQLQKGIKNLLGQQDIQMATPSVLCLPVKKKHTSQHAQTGDKMQTSKLIDFVILRLTERYINLHRVVQIHAVNATVASAVSQIRKKAQIFLTDFKYMMDVDKNQFVISNEMTNTKRTIVIELNYHIVGCLRQPRVELKKKKVSDFIQEQTSNSGSSQIRDENTVKIPEMFSSITFEDPRYPILKQISIIPFSKTKLLLNGQSLSEQDIDNHTTYEQTLKLLKKKQQEM